MCAEGIHDQIIDTYRKEIQNYSNLDSLYEALRSRICEVQSRRNMLEDSIQQLRQDYEQQMDQ